jgi:predicted nucleic acid-binding protein
MNIVTGRYYLDTSIWIDIYEDRVGFNGEPLGEFGFQLLLMIKENKEKIVISDIVYSELKQHYSLECIKGMFLPFEECIIIVNSTTKQKNDAKQLGQKLCVPYPDALHAFLARDNNLVLITRDRHFQKLDGITKHKKPEDIICGNEASSL